MFSESHICLLYRLLCSHLWKSGKGFFFAPFLCPTDNFSKIHLEIPELRPFKRRTDLSIKSRDVESFSIEILFYKERNTLINVLYRPPKGVIKPFERFLKEILKKTNKQKNKQTKL